MGRRLRELANQVGPTRVGTNVFRRVVPLADRLVYALSGGRHTVTGRSLPTLVLHTVGRRSGQPREHPLLYVREGDAYVVAGSNWGQAHHPAWTVNLLADPDAEVAVDGDRHRVVARLATDEERERLWPRFDAAYRGFAVYRERAGDRQIRLFLLEPTSR
ncbi:nitroreductase/quinone reductase family protein [Egicoccus sp. AB-alg2]|uniref:nitroreductase/quinone reductase family protein n=1 Tax=Egicoccus sp. AB-alg2 TaxID=3242693 RepID=UPI00359ED255